MEGQPVKLYGYEKERAQIEAAIAKRRTLQFVCLHGPGGIGKTTMLRAIYEAYRDNDAYRIVNLLDFDDLRLHIVQNVLHAIASQLHSPGEIFSDYFKKAARLREMQHQDVSRLHVEDQEERTRRAFIQDYHTLAAQQQSILLFDTVEKVQDLRCGMNC